MKHDLNNKNFERKAKRVYSVFACVTLLLIATAVPALAADDPLTVVNNLSDFIFSLIRAIGLILLGFGILQVGLSLKSHDPSQRANGMLTVAGGIVITFTKEILSLLVLFFVMGVVKTCGSFTEMKKPEVAFKCFIRFVLAQAAVSWGMELMTGAFRVAQGMVTTIMDSSGLTAMSATTLPDELVSVIEDVGFIDSIPLWAVTLLGSLFIWVLSLVMILTVYSRFFKLYIATAIAPIPLASFAGQPSSSIGVAFLKSYAAICLEGCVIVLACVIFSAFASSPPAIADDTLAAATIVWNYVGELIFNMLVLVGAIKMSDRIIRELMGLG